MPPATAAAPNDTERAQRPARKPPQRAPLPSGFLDARAILDRGLFGSPASLDRALLRPAAENPLPPPHRDALTQRRYWREQDVTAWAQREAARVAARLLPPARWSDRRR